MIIFILIIILIQRKIVVNVQILDSRFQLSSLSDIHIIEDLRNIFEFEQN